MTDEKSRRKSRPEQPEILLPGDGLLIEQANIVADHINHADFRSVRRDARARVIALWDAGLVTANQAAGFERLLGETLSERRRRMRRAG